MIQFVERKNIDEAKWNNCITNANNSMPYAYTWYLDAVAPYWGALIQGNYEYVMPLCFSNKMGFKYLYQPFFTQQGGVYSNNNISAETVNNFLQAIPSKFRYQDFSLNFKNETSSLNGYFLKEKTNLILPLNKPYTEIYNAYNDNIKRNIKKAIKNELQLKDHISSLSFTKFYFENNIKLISNLKSIHLKYIKDIIKNATQNNAAKVFAVYNKEQLIAINLFLFTNNRIISLLPSSNEEGRKLHAMSFLLNHVIEQNANKEMVFDFEGSMIEGVARFYKNFGALNQNYYALKKNNLPALIKLFKN